MNYNEDIINRYLFDEMTVEEKTAFEAAMEEDSKLKQKAYLQQTIIYAVRKKSAKTHFAKLGRRIQAEERRRKVFTIRIAAAALAACLVVGVFVDYNYRESYKGYGFSDNIELLAARDGGTISQVVGEINDEEYKAALATIEEAMAQDISVSERDELEWYKAVTYMRMGKWIKARKLLKQIAASDSAYSEDAQKALKEL